MVIFMIVYIEEEKTVQMQKTYLVKSLIFLRFLLL